MGKTLIAVGSARKPKVEAVRDALGVIRPLMDGNAEFEIVPVEVPSGVRHTPLSRDNALKPSFASLVSRMCPGNISSGWKAGST
jgi:non-canonical (house-cleaning) NTP pyrophosphatase